MSLRDGRFTVSVGPSLRFQGAASSDGTLSAADTGEDGRELNFHGRIDGAEMRGGLYNGRCALAFVLVRTS